jgi:DNA-binding MarR family transcriptional regulator
MQEKEIAYLIKNLDNAIMRKIIHEMGEMKHKPPGPIQGAIARYLMIHENEDVYQRDLEHHLQVNRSTLSGILRTMEKNNMIISIASEKDARMKKIELTPRAKEVRAKFQKGFANIQKELINGIEEPDLKNFYKVLKQISINVENKK